MLKFLDIHYLINIQLKHVNSFLTFGILQTGSDASKLSWFHTDLVPYININPGSLDGYSLAKTYLTTIPYNRPTDFVHCDIRNTNFSVFQAADSIPVNQPTDFKFNYTDFLSVNSNNIKYLTLFKNYFNMTYNQSDYSDAELKQIINAENYIFMIMPKITKIKLNNNYVFVHKYCNNCFYLNSSIYRVTEKQVAPITGSVSGLTN